jgi:hypothetical protein
MQDFGPEQTAPEIPAPPKDNPDLFAGAWDNYGGEHFLNYGRLPGNRFMINWPIQGNDYGEQVGRLIGSEADRQQFFQEAQWHSQSFARFIQTHLGCRYGLAENIFPIVSEIQNPKSFDQGSRTSKIQNFLGGGAFALHPYYRESRRLKGIITIREQDILPIAKGCVAALPIQVWAQGCLQVENVCDAISIGNYANDHHYPTGEIPLQPKSMRWGGRWTGTPFTIPYRALVPAAIDGLLVCEKNISVSHIANGATRLQPCVLGIGQAAGMAAALCVRQSCQPRDLPVRSLQDALLQDAIAPAAVIPLFNLAPKHPQWLDWQQYYLNHPESYPATGCCPMGKVPNFSRTTHVHGSREIKETDCRKSAIAGIFHRIGEQDYDLEIIEPISLKETSLKLVTLEADVNQTLASLTSGQKVLLTGTINPSGKWLLVKEIKFGNGESVVGDP